MTKYFRIGIRLNQKEKSSLEDKASSLCMTLSEYTRFKLMEDEENKLKNENIHSTEFLRWIDKHYKELFRFLVKGAGMSMAHTQLNVPEEMHSQFLNGCREKYEELGIPLEQQSK